MSRLPVSYSSASLFEACPARYHAEKVLKLERTKPIYMSTGTMLHDMADGYLKECVEVVNKNSIGRTPGLFFDDMWKIRKETDIPEALYEELRDIFCTIGQELSIIQPEEIVGSEIEIALTEDWKRTEWDADDAWLRCKIDRLEIQKGGHAKVFDLKSGHAVEDIKESRQLRVYGAAVMAALPKTASVTVELFYPRMKIRRVYVLQDSDIKEGRRWIKAVSDSIEAARAADKWVAKPGKACMDCPAFEDCEARKRKASELPPSDHEEAAALVERLIFVERESKDIKERLKAYVSMNGPVEAGGMAVVFSPVRSFEFPLAKLQEVLLQFDIPIMSVVKADNDALEKFAKKYRGLGPALDGICIEKSRTSFKLIKGEA